MPSIGTSLEIGPGLDSEAGTRNLQTIEKHLRPPLPNARVTYSANNTISHATLTAISWNDESWDVGNLHSTVTNPERLTAPITGLYHIVSLIHWNTNSTGTRQLRLILNSVTLIDLDEHPAGSAPFPTNKIDTFYRLNRGDYVYVAAYQDSGLGVIAGGTAAGFLNYFSMARIGGYTNEGVA